MKDYRQARQKAALDVQQAKYEGRLPVLSEVFLPCVDCGQRATHYEHRDYAKPLKVEAVCAKCNHRRGRARYNPDEVVPKPKPNHSHKCIRCGYQWDSFLASPHQCPTCKSPAWNKPYVARKEQTNA